MPQPNSTDSNPSPPGGNGGNPDGGQHDDGAPRMFSKEEVERKLQGKDSEVKRERKAREALESRLAKIEADAKAREESALAEQGKWKELAEQRAAELKAREDAIKERDARLSSFEEREQKRLDDIAAKNKERLKALPEEIRKDVPKGLDPEAMSGVLSAFEKLIPSRQDTSRGFRGSPRPGAPSTPERAIDEARRRFHDIQMGRRPEVRK